MSRRFMRGLVAFVVFLLGMVGPTTWAQAEVISGPTIGAEVGLEGLGAIPKVAGFDCSDPVVATNDWCDFYSYTMVTTLNGEPVPVGSVVDAFDPQGVHCGTSTVSTAGQWGTMHVYADDSGTPEDEGASPGDTITFQVDCCPGTVIQGDAVWASKPPPKQVGVAGQCPEYTLTVTADPVAGGTTDPSVGLHTYSDGTVVDVTATEAAGYDFDHWSGACTGSGPCQVTMDADKSVTAAFTLSTYTLSVSKSGTGSGTVTSSPAGIDCGGDCSQAYTYNQAVTLSAVATTGSSFTGWSGSGCSGTGSCVVTMDADKSVTAHFGELAPDLRLTKDDGDVTVAAGDTISYDLTYRNDGGDASGVTITETVPDNTTFNGAASTAGWACVPDGSGGSTCTFAVGDVAVTEGGSVTFAVTVDDPLADGVTAISNTAGIGDDGSGGADLNPADNAASDSTPVEGSGSICFLAIVYH